MFFAQKVVSLHCFLKKKKEKEKFRDEHNFCLIDGKPVKCPYLVEGPGLIMSHPGDPKFGAWKYRVDPKDVTLNIVKSKKPEGWKGKIVSSNTSQWVFKYKMDCGRAQPILCKDKQKELSTTARLAKIACAFIFFIILQQNNRDGTLGNR